MKSKDWLVNLLFSSALVLWIFLGVIILINADNNDITYVWAATTGVFFLLLLAIDLKSKEERYANR